MEDSFQRFQPTFTPISLSKSQEMASKIPRKKTNSSGMKINPKLKLGSVIEQNGRVRGYPNPNPQWKPSSRDLPLRRENLLKTFRHLHKKKIFNGSEIEPFFD